MIRLAFVIPTLDQSGAERQLSLLATSLPKDQFLIKVFALNRGGYFADFLSGNGIEVEVLQKRFRFDPFTYIRLKRSLSKFQPQIVQSWLFSANSYVRFPGVCAHGTKIIVSERCVDSWKSRWQLALDQKLANRMEFLTANSQAVALFYERLGVAASRIKVIPNGIPIPEPPPDSSALRREFQFDDNVFLLGFAGRLAPQKRLADLVWGFQLLRQVHDNVRLVLIGDGPERTRLHEIAQHFGCLDKVVFTGHRSDAYKLISGLDAFCLASEFEGMSNSLMEAMSAGVPCVVSNIDANCELIEHEKTGLIFPLGRSPELAKAVIRLIENRSLGHTLGQAGREWIRSHHSVQQLVDAHLALYRQLIPVQTKDNTPCAE